MPEYAARRRVIFSDLCEVYDSQGIQGVFQQFGAAGLYKLFDNWNTGGYWLETKRDRRARIRITAGHPVGSQMRIRDMYVLLTVDNWRGGGLLTLADEDVRPFADALRSSRENSIVDAHVGGIRILKGRDDYEHLRPYFRPVHEGTMLMVPWRHDPGYLDIVLDEDEVYEVERSLPGAVAEVEFYRTLKEQAEALLGEK